MGWLRIHDGFTANAKIGQLTNTEFRVWMRLLCHCANSRDPSVDRVAKREVNGLSSARVSRFFHLGLLDPVGEDFEVHDWPKYMPKEEQNAARQARWRARKRNADSNAESNANTVTERNAPRNAPASRARAGTRGSQSRPEEQDITRAVSVPRPPARDDEPSLNGDFATLDPLAELDHARSRAS